VVLGICLSKEQGFIPLPDFTHVGLPPALFVRVPSRVFHNTLRLRAETISNFKPGGMSNAIPFLIIRNNIGANSFHGNF